MRSRAHEPRWMLQIFVYIYKSETEREVEGEKKRKIEREGKRENERKRRSWHANKFYGIRSLRSEKAFSATYIVACGGWHVNDLQSERTARAGGRHRNILSIGGNASFYWRSIPYSLRSSRPFPALAPFFSTFMQYLANRNINLGAAYFGS